MDLGTRIIQVPCPNCGRTTNETIGVLEHALTVVCAHCGHVIEIDSKLLQSVLDAVVRKCRKAAGDTTSGE
jgi:uncharacterized Zn finger protein